jgi:ParB-like chromosome segregation protein Spo0J
MKTLFAALRAFLLILAGRQRRPIIDPPKETQMPKPLKPPKLPRVPKSIADLKVVRWAIEKLLPYARNARTHTDEQIAQVAASIVEFGWTNPILVGADGVVIAGHARLLAARKLGMTEVPVIVLDHLSETQRRALVLADNRLALSAGWDEEMLRVELESLDEDGFDIDLVGFTDDELAHLLADQDAPADGEDEVPETPETPVTIPGDLWLLGGHKGRLAHRVLCGDSTASDATARLLAGQKPPFIMATDPPYGVGLKPEWREEVGLNPRTRQGGKVSNDDRVDWSAAYSLFPGDVAYVWHAGIHAAEVATGLHSCEFQIRAQIIWKKQHFAISRGAYHWGHEPCWYCRLRRLDGAQRGDRASTPCGSACPDRDRSVEARPSACLAHASGGRHEVSLESLGRPVLRPATRTLRYLRVPPLRLCALVGRTTRLGRGARRIAE